MKMNYVNSSNIQAIGYDALSATLRIEFHGDRVYDYPNISEVVYLELMSAPSHGEYHARHIKHLPNIRLR